MLERYADAPADAGAASAPAATEHVADGQVAYVQASAFHAWRPGSTSHLIAVQSYSPPGAEQRFRTLAAPRENAR